MTSTNTDTNNNAGTETGTRSASRRGNEMLRFATAGSVDDGKSTLIGRLLYDSKSIFEDQLEAVERTSVQRGEDGVNLALLTDGLRAEREQGITIDVAYRYFATPVRKFIIADTPGHIQYTRNMITGASTADVALVLVDARNGIVEQSRRHAVLASILGVPHVVVCVNKMDLVGWDQDRFDDIKAEFKDWAAKLRIPDLSFIPVSALLGDNVVDRSANMPWYRGGSLLDVLESINVSSDRNLVDFRFPVQYVIRPYDDQYHDYRGYAGRVAGGSITAGEKVTVLPSGFTSTIAAIETMDGPVEEAFPPMSVTIRLTDDIDISRGDMLVRDGNRPEVTQDVDSMLCWLSETPMDPRATYRIKTTTREARVRISGIEYRMDVNTLGRDTEVDRLGLNEIGRVRLRSSAPLMLDRYDRNRETGSFILIDEATNATVAAGMVR